MINKIFLILTAILLQQIKSLPQNYTSIFQVKLLVDEQYRGDLQFGLYTQLAPKASFNILRNCNQTQLSNHLNEKQGKKEENQEQNEKKPQIQAQKLEKLQIDKIQKGEFLQFGQKNMTYELKEYYSEINDMHTEIGALSQQRNEEDGNVGARYSVHFKRAGYDGRNSLWHVFGVLIKGFELLKFIDEIGGENDGIPNRNISFGECQILKF